MTPWPAPDFSMVIGRLVERSDQGVEMLRDIQKQIDTVTSTLSSLDSRIRTLETKPDPMPPWERLVKLLLPYGIGLAALAVTGSLDTAVKIATALAK